ncbi:branched-chain amino acid aminotransferase [Thalassoglobus sp.]|uniref:branched-chain amino acid aminotransferase n=1 Tax=Thalassoglobus sp. TaxID=2795869 RepID=UPI003AA83CE8
MKTFNQLLNDEAGFIVSAELILVATIVVLGLIVGLAELSMNINHELEDVGTAFNNMQQSYSFDGTSGHKGSILGSSFDDSYDFCSSECDVN